MALALTTAAHAQPLGERVVVPVRPPSSFLVATGDGPPNDGSTGPWNADALRLAAGTPGIDGVAPLALAADAVLDVPVFDDQHLCFKLFAAESRGFLDCDGGSLADVFVSQNSNGAGEASALSIAIGTAPGSPGAARMAVVFAVTVAASSCAGVDFDSLPTFPGILTTGRLVSTVTQARQGGDVTLDVRGESFSCADWAAHGPGAFVGLPGNLFDVGTESGIADLASALRLEAARPAGDCAGDCDGDGEVDTDDLARLLALFGRCPPCGAGAPAGGCPEVGGAGGACPTADRDGNGCVSAGELTRILECAGARGQP